MIEYILPHIKDPVDYITALSMFRVSTPLTAEEGNKLLTIYKKYLSVPESEDAQYAKVCLAVDLMPGRNTDDQLFEKLGLSAANLTALYLAKDIAAGNMEWTAETAEQVVDAVQGPEVSDPVRVLLARLALDTMTVCGDFTTLREQIGALAEILTGYGSEVLDRYIVLVGEVRKKCMM